MDRGIEEWDGMGWDGWIDGWMGDGWRNKWDGLTDGCREGEYDRMEWIMDGSMDGMTG